METKLQHLHGFLVDSLKGLVHPGKIHASQAGGKVIVDGEDRGNEGYRIAYWQYDAGVLIESFPHLKMDPKTLFAMLACWISQFDGDRDVLDDLSDPEIEVDENNEATADVLIRITFAEQIEIVPDENGPIVWNDIRYKLNPVDIWVAEEAEITNDAGNYA
ncbi:phage tail protein [Photobacterium ganghwense]|uniref:Tail protein n=1 Tax=Photobacterium ganghwense TaxID=320778 RepID=A0A0J1H8I6_9GAMM|nr:phage tail protein [Photobacterium ganghwense]KLV07976.1 hypothetical protein ABT57_14100 [Photobacterium ganghwense]MBV1843362.1 phage tail protein [Photobacterium ganghwense]PSU07082.1 hypothetical protein C9I92_15110 [Photobacterium ganghwense]QSV15837.1 phage tail protein [Photobacterium ganghwense]